MLLWAWLICLRDNDQWWGVVSTLMNPSFRKRREISYVDVRLPPPQGLHQLALFDVYVWIRLHCFLLYWLYSTITIGVFNFRMALRSTHSKWLCWKRKKGKVPIPVWICFVVLSVCESMVLLLVGCFWTSVASAFFIIVSSHVLEVLVVASSLCAHKGFRMRSCIVRWLGQSFSVAFSTST